MMEKLGECVLCTLYCEWNEKKKLKMPNKKERLFSGDGKLGHRDNPTWHKCAKQRQKKTTWKGSWFFVVVVFLQINPVLAAFYPFDIFWWLRLVAYKMKLFANVKALLSLCFDFFLSVSPSVFSFSKYVTQFTMKGIWQTAKTVCGRE